MKSGSRDAGLLSVVFSCSFSGERDQSPARWECGNRSSDFQGRWETKGNLVLVFLVFHGPAFPRRSPVSCALALRPESEKELSFGFLHLPGRFGVAVRSRDPVQALDAEFRFEIAFCGRQSARQFPQCLPRRGVTPVHILLFAALIYDPFWLSTRTMEVQIGVEAALVEPVDVFGVRGGDVTVAHVLADHRPVFGFHQAVVVAFARARFGLLD